LLASVLIALPCQACLNDRDTLANEANRYPNVLQTITGRFERNPPLYYTMRIQRVSTELKSNPDLLSVYDDAGVACDRIGSDNAALQWMDRKYRVLQTADAKDPAIKEQWYRYYANTGTFLVHQWVRAGADRDKISEVNKARAYIAKALAINPDAHFGREKYQLKVMNWIVDGEGISLADYLKMDPDVQSQTGRRKAVTALCGLVVLGNAWESVDLFHALSVLLSEERYDYTERFADLAQYRCDELIDQGQKSLMPDSPTGAALKAELALRDPPDPNDLRMFHMLRAEADQWQKARSDYMMAQLTAGRHPDTDPAFWSGFHDYPPPHIRNPWDEAIYLAIGKPLNIEYLFFWPMCVIVLLIAWGVGRRIYRRRASACR
jgi:tetratricopeptide (TPR) repeat protein